MTKIGAAGLVHHSDKFNGMYRGTVMANSDSDELGKVKVKVYPMLSGVATENLPWAIPAMPLTVGAGSGYGNFTVPDVGTNVWVFFEQGDIYQPVYFAEATDGAKGLPSDKSIDYPNTSILETATGIKIKINRKGGSEHIRVDHPTGTYIEIDPDGKVIVVAVDDINMSTDEKVDIVAAETKSVTISAPTGSIHLDASMVSVSGSLTVNNAADGQFTSADSKIITVVAGVVTLIEPSS